jgi:hypothetical protein
MDLLGQLGDWILSKILGSPAYRDRKLSVRERLLVVAIPVIIVVGLALVAYPPLAFPRFVRPEDPLHRESMGSSSMENHEALPNEDAPNGSSTLAWPPRRRRVE